METKLKNLAQEDLQAISDVMGGLLDKQAAVLASKEDIKDMATKQDIKDMATKTDLKDLETRLNQRVDEGFEAVMGGMDALAEKLAEKEKVERLAEWAMKVAEKVGVYPKL